MGEVGKIDGSTSTAYATEEQLLEPGYNKDKTEKHASDSANFEGIVDVYVRGNQTHSSGQGTPFVGPPSPFDHSLDGLGTKPPGIGFSFKTVRLPENDANRTDNGGLTFGINIPVGELGRFLQKK